MNTAQHTPGPWMVEPDEDGLFLVVDESREMDYIYIDQQQDNREANARLIAAAPEMLAALEVVVESWTSQFERNGHLAPDWCKQARAAIAKATGSKP